MGYDLYLQVDGHPLIRQRPELFSTIPQGEEYFSIGAWNMSRFTGALELLGMMSTSEFPTADIPDVPEKYQHLFIEDLPRRIQDEITAFKSDHGDGTPGIPEFKLSDNSGWIVTAQECRDALAVYDTHDRPKVLAALRECAAPDPMSPGNNGTAQAGAVLMSIFAAAGVQVHDNTDQPDPGLDPDRWDEFVVFLRHGAKHDGFQVR